MMKIFKYLIFLALIAIAIALASPEEDASASTALEYLNRQLREIKVNIAKSYSPDPPIDRTYDIRWNPLWEKHVNSDNALALSFSNETFVLADDRVLHVQLDVSSKDMLHQVAIINHQKAAKFLRTIVWKESLFLLICQEDGSCSLHVGLNTNELRYRQIVKHRGLPMDAQFFTLVNQLYLVVADNSGQFSVPSVIYRWTGTYMDVIAEIATTGAVSVTTFNHKQSTIIIFAQNVQGRPRIGSEVFKFKNGLVEKIQFLATDGPVSVHRYEHDKKIFLLVINGLSASRVFWWDGKEFLNWMELREIQSPTKVDIVYVGGDTLLLVSQENTLSLYRIMNLAYTKLKLLDMKDRSIMDFNARVNGDSIILVMVTKSDKNFYRVEPVELAIKKLPSENSTQEADDTLEYLEQLDQLLKDRMPAIETAHSFWPSLLPFAEDIVVSSPLKFDDLVIDSGSILDLRVSSPADILTPTELASGLEQMNLAADSLISQSSDFIFSNETAVLMETVVVKGDAFFDEMHVDSLIVEVLNGQKVDFDGVLSYTKDQDFPDPLRGNIISIDNLEIDYLCGIPFENWLMTNDTDRTTLDLFSDTVKILNDTILVQSDLSLDNLGVFKLNNLDLNSFVADLFILGSQQEIAGTIFYKQGLNVYDLRINATNGISVDQLLTKTTDQKLEGDVLIKSLYVDEIFVETINNVSVNEAARISEENVISGQVTFRNLRITDELFVDGVSQLFDLRPIQLYSTVEINGDLVVKSLDFNPGSSLHLNDLKVDVDYLFKNYWTKSTNQTILDDINLARGITIDDLHADYLNGYAEDDFLYTTAIEITEKFGPLHFKRLEIDGLLLADGREVAESIASDDNLIVNQKIQITNLEVGDLRAQTYNKIPVEYIARGKVGVKIPGRTKYENLVVENDLRVGELQVKFLNDRNLTNFFKEALVIDENYAIDYMELENLETDNFQVKELNDLKMIEFYRMLKYKDITAIKNVTVDGDLLVNGNLKVDFINDINIVDFIETLSRSDIDLKGHEMFDRFVVFGDLRANLLGGIKIEDLADNTLSRTKAQRISGHYSFYKLQADDLIAEIINEFDVTSLKLVSDPLIIEGDVNFSDLHVQGDIITGYLNDQDVTEIYESALHVPYSRIENLTINGSIFWEDSAMELKSLSYLYNKSVTKNTNQTISGEVVFRDYVCTYRLTCEKNITDVDIRSIVLDAVYPIGQAIVIKGQKLLKKGLTAKKLTVSGDIGIQNINGWDILNLNSTIVRKFETQTISGATNFLRDVTIERLEVEGRVHGLPTQGIITFNDTLPSNVRFTNIEVQNGLRVKKLDGIDFEEFIKNRVTLNGDHEVYNDILFLDPVIVTQNAVLSSINGINVSEVALSDTETAQVISGEKIFLKDFSVHGNVTVDLINDMRITEEYRNGILNNEDIYIDGNIIFEADFETFSNVSVHGYVNGVNLKQFSENISNEAQTIVRELEKNQSYVDRMIDRSINHSRFLPDIFFYFDVQPELVINAPNIRKVQSLTVESMTKLNLYGTEEGWHCGLPDFCPCPTQYMAELLDYECKIWKMNGSRIIYNVHDSEGRFGVNIVSNTTSSDPLCTQDNPGTEFTTISWMNPRQLSTGHIIGEIRNESLKINGYLSDAKTFTIGEKLYVVLAIYYIPDLKSHDVNSLVYEIDLNSNEIKLVQEISTSSAVALDVFATELHGLHLLIACGHDPAESQLHRFNIHDSKFELLRTFRTGGSRNVKSIIQGEESFVLLDDPLANSVHIFNYKIEFDNYHFYQSLYHGSTVKNIEVFYSGEFGASDAYVIVTTDEGRFFLYEYMFFGGFQLRVQQWLDGVQTMASFQFSRRRYIFAGTVKNSTVYRIVEQGPNYY